jgi:hypothetical protein
MRQKVAMLNNLTWLWTYRTLVVVMKKSTIIRQVFLSDREPWRCGGRSWLTMLLDKDVDIIYVGTPNTSHYNDAMAALQAGKHCLLEKPATLNAGQWKTLSELAKSKKLFLMEGWCCAFENKHYLD